MEKIKFIGSLLTVSDSAVNIESFKTRIADASNPSHIFGATYNNFVINYYEDYLTIYIKSGKPYPHPTEVINLETEEPEDNPRSTLQIEPKQSFALIDFNTSIFWISNVKKKSCLIEFLVKTFKENVREKEIYNQEQFVQTIKRLNEIKFSAAPNLFSGTDVITSALSQDINGYGAEIATLYMRFGNILIMPSLITKITNILNSRERIKDIVISGRDEAGRGMIFNSDLFAKSILIEASVDTNEMFNPGEVFTNLINAIKNEG